jgi:hypothetical protein
MQFIRQFLRGDGVARRRTASSLPARCGARPVASGADRPTRVLSGEPPELGLHIQHQYLYIGEGRLSPDGGLRALEGVAEEEAEVRAHAQPQLCT